MADALAPDPSARVYWAHRFTRTDGLVYYMTVRVIRHFVELHYFSEPIVQVRLRECGPSDPPPNAWGWVDAKEPDHYLFVWPSRGQRDMCFPYGPEAEEKRGRRRRVDLILEEVPDPNPGQTEPPA